MTVPTIDHCMIVKRRILMKTVQSERDYAYGAAILTLRTNIGLTQAELADHLGITRLAVGKWETGNAYPKPEHLKALIELAVLHQALSTENEASEIRALWKVSRQKVLLDEHWLSTLLQRQAQELHVAPASVPQTPHNTLVLPPPETREKSDDAPTIPLLHEHKDAKALQTTRRHKWLLAIVITLAILIITGAGGTLLLHIASPQTHPYPEYLSGNGTLAFFDPLSQESRSQWTSYGPDSLGLSCQFTGGAYHVSKQQTSSFNWCPASRIFSNFAFEVQLTIM